MASFGAKYPVFAPFAGEETAGALPVYGSKVIIGRMVKADLTVTLATGEIYSDDELSERIDEFASGQIAMETDDMTGEVASIIYGATADEAKKTVTYKVGDEPPYGGLCYYKVLQRNGKRVYKGYYYPKVRAALGNDSAATRSNSITFGTTATSFTVFAAETGEWRINAEFATEAEVRAFIDEKLQKPAEQV